MSNLARSRAIQKYKTDHPDLEHQLDFFERLWAIQDEFEAKAAEYAPVSKEETVKALKAGQTLLSLSVPEVPLEAYRDAVRAIAKEMADNGGLPAAQSEALAEKDLGEAVSAEALAEALSGFDVFVTSVVKAADDERIGEPVVSFILSEAMTPFLRGAAKTAAEAAGKFDWLLWDSGLCPACGTPASSGVVRDEGELQGGRRWLSCPLCRAEWEYARLRCPRCGSRNHQDLAYIYDSEDPGHRIHTCNHCHGYTPVSFEKEIGVIAIPEVEEVVMVRLETVAADRGFTPLGDQLEETAH